jgi:hypothetical protein
MKVFFSDGQAARATGLWRGASRFSRGDLRITYYLRSRQGEIWLLTLYAKNVSENISANILRKIKEQIDESG